MCLNTLQLYRVLLSGYKCFVRPEEYQGNKSLEMIRLEQLLMYERIR